MASPKWVLFRDSQNIQLWFIFFTDPTPISTFIQVRTSISSIVKEKLPSTSVHEMASSAWLKLFVHSDAMWTLSTERGCSHFIWRQNMATLRSQGACVLQEPILMQRTMKEWPLRHVPEFKVQSCYIHLKFELTTFEKYLEI